MIRYYEDIDLLPPAARGENGYRVYNQADVERLRFIQWAKALDFSLEESRRYWIYANAVKRLALMWSIKLAPKLRKSRARWRR
jgi:DNA-binding transcriptional MerR regulator